MKVKYSDIKEDEAVVVIGLDEEDITICLRGDSALVLPKGIKMDKFVRHIQDKLPLPKNPLGKSIEIAKWIATQYKYKSLGGDIQDAKNLRDGILRLTSMEDVVSLGDMPLMDYYREDGGKEDEV